MEGLSRLMLMPEGKIQELEKYNSAQMSSMIGTIGLQKTSELFITLLRSYRVAASVANAAWRVTKDAEAGQITGESWQLLQKTLHLYSPGNFRPFKSDLEFYCCKLEELYDYLSQWNNTETSTMVIMEQLYEKIREMRGVLASAQSQ